jgi:Ca-activated chloride channel family protein
VSKSNVKRDELNPPDRQATIMKSIYCSIFLGLLACSLASAQDQPQPLTVSAKLETPLVLEKADHAHVLVRLRAAEADPNKKAKKLNLALIIDRSGSMSGRKIEDARAAAIQMLDRMRDGDRVSLISYSDQVRVDAASTVLNERTRTQVRNAIHRISDGGSTNLGGGLVEGIKQVSDHVGTSDVNRVLLISDGLSNKDIQKPAELNRLSREALQKGVITTTIGLGADYNEDLMTSIADHGGGNYYFVKESDQIAGTLTQELGQMSATVARNVTLHVVLTEGIDVDKVHGWVVKREDRTLIVPLGDFFSGQSRSVLWKFKLPEKSAAGEKLDLGSIHLAFNTLDVGAAMRRVKTDPLVITVSDDKDQVASGRDMEVAARIAEIELATSVEDAANLVTAGKYDEAKRVLKEAVLSANQQGDLLPESLRKDLITAAEEAQEMEANVDKAEADSKVRKEFSKGGKASSRALKKK